MFFTQNPIGSSATEDLQDNAISLDYAMNSPAALWQDRFGKQHKTVQQALKDVGFKPAGFDFVSGGTLGIGDRDKCVFYPTDGYWYSWNGKLPYVVPANSSPTPGGKKGWGLVTRDERVVAREALRRTYQEVGLNLVEGSFEQGAVITSTTDVVLHEKTGKCYSGPIGNVPKGTDPLSSSFVDVSTLQTRRKEGYIDAWGCRPGVLDDKKLQTIFDSLGHIRIPPGRWLYKKINLHSNLVIEGDNNVDCILEQVQPSDEQRGGFCKEDGSDLSNVQFITLGFDGNRISNPTSMYNHICYLPLNGNETVSDILVYRCELRNAQEDFFNITSFSNTARVKNVKVVLSRFFTEKNKINLPGNLYATSGNALRVWNRADVNTSYGIPVFTDIGVTGCFGEKIRTLADLKRGVKTFSITNNNTVNCRDCHISFDGAFDGVVSGNIGRNESSWDVGERPNMIEGQGENVIVSDNQFDGGNNTLSMILISDYGHPDEGNGTTITNVGHHSVNVLVQNNIGRNVKQNMFHGINNRLCQWLNNTSKSSVSHGFAQSSGTARNNSVTGEPLKAIGNTYNGNSEASAGLPLSINGCEKTTLGINTDEHGNFSLFTGTEDLVLKSKFANYKFLYQNSSLTPNYELKLTQDGVSIENWSCPRNVALASSKPLDAINAVTITDDSTTANLEHTPDIKIPVSINDYIFVTLDIKKNTANSCSVLIKELDETGTLLVSYFKALTNIPTTWTSYITSHKVKGETCKAITVSFVPAASYNNPSSTGKTDISKFYVGRTPG